MVIAFWIMWILALFAMGALFSCGYDDAKPFKGDVANDKTDAGIVGNDDVSNHDSSDSGINRDGSSDTVPDALSDVLSGDSVCPAAGDGCSIALNPSPMTVCVSPTQGPYNDYYACAGKNVCCVRNAVRGGCEYLTCVTL